MTTCPSCRGPVLERKIDMGTRGESSLLLNVNPDPRGNMTIDDEYAQAIPAYAVAETPPSTRYLPHDYTCPKNRKDRR
jgi:hypothetical protein